jgi:sugar transferase (PEP-CTERM/EpsH1 system associated)
LRKKLLYLVHRLPYPPNKGDKIASYYQFKHLAQNYDISVGCFIDDASDWQYVDEFRPMCEQLYVAQINSKLAKLMSLRGLLVGEALGLPYYRNQELQQWVDKQLATGRFDAVLVFSGVMAQYVPFKPAGVKRYVIDFVDVDSDKWRLYAKDHRWPINWIYRREARTLLEFERSMAARADASVFVSREEAELFKQLAPEVADKVTYRIQGVDSDHFDPALEFASPYSENEKALVFTGAMDYWPNVDAVVWFAKEVFPKVREQVGVAKFYIVGMNPTPEVQALSRLPGVIVTGKVDDVRPYIRHAWLAALPVRVARGIQNKVLEAMAMQKPVLAATAAIHGIEGCVHFKPYVSDDEQQLADYAIELLSKPPIVDAAARECVLEKYNWTSNLQKVEALLEPEIE